MEAIGKASRNQSPLTMRIAIWGTRPLFYVQRYHNGRHCLPTSRKGFLPGANNFYAAIATTSAYSQPSPERAYTACCAREQTNAPRLGGRTRSAELGGA